jgi:hypothetical protein
MGIDRESEMSLRDYVDVRQCMRMQNENLKLKYAIHALCFWIEE